LIFGIFHDHNGRNCKEENRNVTSEACRECLALLRHKLSNYGFALKEALNEEDNTTESRLNKLREEFFKKGTRKSIEVVMLVYERGHAHVLVLQSGSYYKL
jgi:hypothetical protein